MILWRLSRKLERIGPRQVEARRLARRLRPWVWVRRQTRRCACRPGISGHFRCGSTWREALLTGSTHGAGWHCNSREATAGRRPGRDSRDSSRLDQANVQVLKHSNSESASRLPGSSQPHHSERPLWHETRLGELMGSLETTSFWLRRRMLIWGQFAEPHGCRQVDPALERDIKIGTSELISPCTAETCGTCSDSHSALDADQLEKTKGYGRIVGCSGHRSQLQWHSQNSKPLNPTLRRERLNPSPEPHPTLATCKPPPNTLNFKICY